MLKKYSLKILMCQLKCSNATQKVQGSAAYCFSTAGGNNEKKDFYAFYKGRKKFTSITSCNMVRDETECIADKS